MQVVKYMTLVAPGVTQQVPCAFVLTKNEVAALLAACGHKRSSLDYRSVWFSWYRTEVVACDNACLARLSESAEGVNVPDTQVLADDLKQALADAGAKVKDMILVAPTPTTKQRRVAVAVASARDVQVSGDVVKTRFMASYLQPTELTLSHDTVSRVFARSSSNACREAKRSVIFDWDARFVNVLSKVCKAAGDGRVRCAAPVETSDAFHATVTSTLLDAGSRWDVLIMPLGC